jgi:predicted nucleic acid-binding protein
VIVVIDTSVVLNLCFLHQEGLLSALFDGLLAPSAVRDEFERLARVDARFRGLSFPSFIIVEDPIVIPARLRDAEELDAVKSQPWRSHSNGRSAMF